MGGLLQALVGYTMFVLFEGALVWNLYADWLPDPARAPNPSCEKHLQFAMHSFIAMFLTGGVLTYLFSDIDWSDTPFTRRYGYNEITVLFEYAPSVYVMPAYWFVTGAGFLLYCLEDTKRLLRQTEEHPGTTASYAVNLALAVSTLLFSLTLAVRAGTDMTAHFFPALLLVLVLPLPFVLQAFEGFWKRMELQRPDRSYGLLIIFVSWFTAVSVLKVCLSLFAVFAKPVSPSLAKPVDGLWIFLAFVVPFLLHPSPGNYQQLMPAEQARPPGAPLPQQATAAKWMTTACTFMMILAATGVAYAACAKNPATAVLQSGSLTSNSAVGFETVRRSEHCADRGEQCHCPDGFVIFGRGRLRSYFRAGTPMARWDVYPLRVKESLVCSQSVLGDPFIFSRSEECRCVAANLQCEQLSEPIAHGCGTGSSADLIDMEASSEELSCCSNHDRCYGLCSHTKQQCDEEFQACLQTACKARKEQSACEELIKAMNAAIGAQSAEVEFSLAQRSQQHWVLTDVGKRPSGEEETRSNGTEGNESHIFNCHLQSEFWQLEWSEAKKDWCCKKSGKGCMKPVPVSPAPLSLSLPDRATSASVSTSPSNRGDLTATTRRRTTTAAPSQSTTAKSTTDSRKEGATSDAHKNAPDAKAHKPFNCLTTDSWPEAKTVWCCANLGLGCKDAQGGLRRLARAAPAA